MKPFEIFRTGTHTDSQGRTRTFTESDLDHIAQSYDPSHHEAPITIGHPKDNQPAFGWIEKVKRVGQKLIAYPKQVAAEFEEMVKKGLFKKRSISLNADGTLRHVAFLGAQPPAVKGLKDVTFGQDEEQAVFEFSEWADAEDDLASGAEQGDNGGDYAERIAALESELKQAKDEIASFSQKEQALQEEAARKLLDIRLKMRKLEFEQYLNEKIAYGSVTPAQSKKILKLLEVLQSVQFSAQDPEKAIAYEFSDGEKQEPVSLLKEFVETLPKQVEFQETARKDKAAKGGQDDANPAQIAQKAREYKEEQEKTGRVISFTEAVKHVTNS